MTLNDYYLKFGTEGLRKLAKATGRKLSYIQQLIYTPTKTPSLKTAEQLVKASDGLLTYEGLANPSKNLNRDN